MVSRKYRLYKAFGKPIFASPLELRRIALQLYQPFNFRRSVYRSVLRASMLFGADRYLSSQVDWPLQVLDVFDLDGWLHSMYGPKVNKGLGSIIFFPSEASFN